MHETSERTETDAPEPIERALPERKDRTEKPEKAGRGERERLDREARFKLARLGEFLDRHQLDGVLLQRPNNFAWITCGRNNRVPNNAPHGVAAILATEDSRICLANSIEAPRLAGEELAGTGIEVVSFPWWDRKAAAIKLIEAMGGRKIAADIDPLDLKLRPLSEEFNKLRWALRPEEIARYRDGASRASAAVDAAAREVAFGATEFEAAGVLSYHLHARGCNPLVTLAVADERAVRFRQALPSERKIDQFVMLVAVAELSGLISCLTRFVAFRPVSGETERKVQALANIDAAVNLATRPGRSLADVFRILQQAYADNGFADEWQHHHQGGSTGYANREVLATPGAPTVVRENQAFAWNPSIPGFKVEDTVLCTDRGVEILTDLTEDWPTVIGRCDAGELPRADILVR
jgi:Xaa-Pro aminopeptidase